MVRSFGKYVLGLILFTLGKLRFGFCFEDLINEKGMFRKTFMLQEISLMNH